MLSRPQVVSKQVRGLNNEGRSLPVEFMKGVGKPGYVCVVGTAPLQRHPTVPIFAAGSGFESRKSRRNAQQRTLAFVVLWTLQTDTQLHYTPRSVSSSLSLSLSFCAARARPRAGLEAGVEKYD